MKSLIALSIFISLATPAVAQQILETTCESVNKCQKQISVPAGKSVVIAPGINTASPNGCTAIVPTIKTIVKPRFGQIVPRIVPYTNLEKELSGLSMGSCAGKAVKGLQLTYVANKDAKGDDKIVITVDSRSESGSRTQIYEYNISIQ
ncbi:MAG: hypothetical protein J0I29_06270 [Rhizobiales bacterium]|nr:hypothetical protein [Hyphomicrobiales bacterium]